MDLEPIKFELDGEYRPSLSKIQKFGIDGKSDEHVDFRMDNSISQLAKQSILMRLTEMKILEQKKRFRMFRRNRESDIDLVTYVIDGETDRPPYNISIKSFNKIKEGGSLTIGDPGLMIYEREGKIPRFLDIRILVVRNKQGTRDIGEALTQIKNNENFKSVTNTLSSLLTSPFNILTNQVDNIMGIIGAILKMQKDEKLLYYACTYHRDYDNLGIGQLKCHTLPKNSPKISLCHQVRAGEVKGITYG